MYLFARKKYADEMMYKMINNNCNIWNIVARLMSIIRIE